MDYIIEKGRIYLNNENNEMVAEVTFPSISEKVVNINHTFVDNSLRGQGVASKLMVKLAQKLREDNLKAYLSCSYAVNWFEKHKEYNDIMAENYK